MKVKKLVNNFRTVISKQNRNRPVRNESRADSLMSPASGTNQSTWLQDEIHKIEGQICVGFNIGHRAPQKTSVKNDIEYQMQ